MANNPFEELYANWLKSLGTQQPSLNAAAAQWQKATADFWQMPAAYWQTFSTIMGSRGQAIQRAMEKSPQHMQALASCTSWPEFVGKAASIQGEMLSNFINLDLTTNAYRAGLWKEWSNLATRNQPQPESSPSANRPAASTPQPAASQPAAKPSAPQPKAAAAPVAQPAPKPVVAPQPQPAAAPLPPVKENLGQRKPIFAHNPPRPLVSAAAPQPQPKPVVAQSQSQSSQSEMLLTGTTGVAHATTSSTANSVMRASGGSTIASAAARRSVVARRQSRRRTPR